jgi:1-acyl-sn-glycerol-3-phosphate acyltransferase
MRKIGWAILNALQALFTFFWTMSCVSAALLVLVVTMSRGVPLAMARRLWAAGLLWGAGARIEITGLELVDFTRPHVFVSNHESMIDIPVIFRALPVNLHFIIKKELKLVPFVGWYAWAMGMIFVERSDKRRGLRGLKNVGRLIKEGRNVIAFPEGTRSRGRGVLPFKKGVFVAAAGAGVPIVPVAISGADRVLPSDGFRVRPGLIRVALGQPIPTTGPNPAKTLPDLARVAVAALHAAQLT